VIAGGVAGAFALHGIASAIRARKQPIARHEPDGVTAEGKEG